MAVFHLTKKEPIQSEREYAESHDEKDSLRHLRAEFIIPTKGDLKSKTLSKSSMHCSILTDPANVSNHLEAQTDEHSNEPCIYLCGNSLGLQPKRTSELVASHLTAWATKGVLGHFTEHEDSTLPPFLHVDDVAAERMAPVVGALPSEVAVMETLTANLHFLMASFYKPTKTRYKIMLEGKAFPSDHVCFPKLPPHPLSTHVQEYFKNSHPPVRHNLSNPTPRPHIRRCTHPHSTYLPQRYPHNLPNPLYYLPAR